MRKSARGALLRGGEYTLSLLCLRAAEKYKNKTAFSMLSEGQIINNVTYSQMRSRALLFAGALRGRGIQKDQKVLLISENCPQWPLAYFGIALAGAVSVPLLTGFSLEQIENILINCGAKAVCISRGMAEKYRFTEKPAQSEINKERESVFKDIPFIVIDSVKEDTNGQAGISVLFNGIENHLTIDPSQCVNHSSGNPDDLAAIIYTSGTQGSSKGVMLSGRNIISCAVSSYTFIKTNTRDLLLSVLPLAHSYECSLGLLAPLMRGSRVTYIDRPPSPSVLLSALKLLRPTAMLTVPLLIEKIYSNAVAPNLNKSKLYKFPVTRSFAVWLSGRKLARALGGRLRFLGIGGAPLSREVEQFLIQAKLPYSVGYGLTEAAPLVAGNAARGLFFKPGNRVPKGVSVKIEPCLSEKNSGEGEILVKGPNVMMGYYKDERRTREVMTSDGWLRTGDLGCFDKEGRLYVKGRLKAMILGPSGENIYPEEIEGLLGASSLIEESLVYSGKRGELVALVRLSEAARLKQRAKDAADIIEHALEELRAWVNKKLAVFSRLSRIEIRYEPFEKTPTMKIKRYLYI